jgi:hypothetical protein
VSTNDKISARDFGKLGLLRLSKSMTLAPRTHCDMNEAPLSPIERAIVAALVSAIVKELQLQPPPAGTSTA